MLTLWVLGLLFTSFGNLKKSKEKLDPVFEMCNHSYQNKIRQGESQTKSHWHSRHKRICYATMTMPLE